MLDFNSPIPLYHQLAELLSRSIALGEYQPGSRVPSEPELARRFAIGRPTVRQAMDVLVRRGQLRRRRGAGTFVAERRHQVDLFSLGGTIAAFESQGIPIESKWLEGPVCLTVPRDARSPLAGELAFRVRRLSSLAERPVLLEAIHLRATVFPDFARVQQGARSISELVRDEYRMLPSRGRQLFRIVRLDDSQASLLGTAPGTAALLVERTLDFPGADAAVHAELCCLTDQVVLAQTLEGELR